MVIIWFLNVIWNSMLKNYYHTLGCWKATCSFHLIVILFFNCQMELANNHSLV
jgi:hypothetical protein